MPEREREREREVYTLERKEACHTVCVYLNWGEEGWGRQRKRESTLHTSSILPTRTSEDPLLPAVLTFFSDGTTGVYTRMINNEKPTH